MAGQTEAQARATLENAGLEVDVQRVTSEEEAGRAVGTDPPEGSEVDEGDTVVLRVSEGPGLTTVPDVEGENEADATAELRRADFQVERARGGERRRRRGDRHPSEPPGAGRRPRPAAL